MAESAAKAKSAPTRRTGWAEKERPMFLSVNAGTALD
jgi:hypothetical protein